MSRLISISFLVLASLVAWHLFVRSISAAEPGAESGEEAISFNRDIRPILAENCYTCHGPDASKRKAKLRLDQHEGATADLGDGRFAVVPGKPDESELIARVNAEEADVVMPPKSVGKQLTKKQVELLTAWVKQGAQWQSHWSLITPRTPAIPKVTHQEAVRNPIDAFVLARLEQSGLSPSPAADTTTLARRISLDLTGLPPTVAEVDELLRDTSPNAYEKYVDKLLASPHYGEQMATYWLDAARYADTSGYQVDNLRTMWGWRDWVINAYNTNMPFDQFTVEQLAGDLLPDATTSQRVATGFNRNHRISNEGGIIEEELRVEYVVDRVNTTSSVWLGLTVGCAQCHDHKYDPISQKDYYRLFAFFNSVADKGNDGGSGNAAPILKLPTAEQTRREAELREAITKLEAKRAESDKAADSAQAAWEADALKEIQIDWKPLSKAAETKSAGGATLTRLEDGSTLAGGTNPDNETYTIIESTDSSPITAFRLEALTHPSLPENGAGRAFNSNFVLSEFEVQAVSATDPNMSKNVKFASAYADYSQNGYEIAKAIDGDSKTGWAVDGPTKKENRTAVFVPTEPVGFPGGTILQIHLRHEQISKHSIGRFRISLRTDPSAATLPLPADIRAILVKAGADRNIKDSNKLRDYHRNNVAAQSKSLVAELDQLRKEERSLASSIMSTMVMQDLPKPRESFILKRGQYDQHGEPVEPGVPSSLPALASGVTPNRLALAKWLVDPSHPLTARVAVNNIWQMHFGTGLVKTVSDFGSQGDWPSHPDLLDWLATEFMNSGWDVKHLHKLIVMSSIYRQASKVTPRLLEIDPENRLLARGPRFRLSAETIRDNALAVSGTLSQKIGGPPVKPYQPAGLWEEVSYPGTSTFSYKQDTGESLYRRSLYTFWKRTVPPAALATFDAPSREVCTIGRARTNTPLQSLVLLNDPTYVEASRKLAELVIREAKTPEERITLAFRRAVARHPSSDERTIMVDGLQRRLAKYKTNPESARKLVHVGESKPDASIDAGELAAYTSVSGIILNLDETISRE